MRCRFARGLGCQGAGEEGRAQGTFTIETEGQPVKELGSGSYVRDPGKLKHRSGCKAGGPECVFFVEQTGPWDVIVAEEKK